MEVMQWSNCADSRAETRKFNPKGSCPSVAGTISLQASSTAGLSFFTAMI